MKSIYLTALACLCLFAMSSFADAQECQRDNRSTTAKVLRVTGKVVAETAKAAANLGAASVKATTEHVVVPTAKTIWDPFLKKTTPKVVGETAKLTGKGLKNGFKLLFKRRKQTDDSEQAKQT